MKTIYVFEGIVPLPADFLSLFPMTDSRGCSVEGCDRPHHGKGFCSSHHSRFQRHGDPLKGNVRIVHGGKCTVAGCEKMYHAKGLCRMHYGRLHQRKVEKGSLDLLNVQLTLKNQQQIREVLKARSVVNPTTGCWEWARRRHSYGYGKVWIDKSEWLAHRASAVVFLGLDPQSDLFACHHCDNPCCLNPSHLFIGTAKDNMVDMVRKGRHKGGHTEAKAEGSTECFAEEGQIKEVGYRSREGDRGRESRGQVSVSSLRVPVREGGGIMRSLPVHKRGKARSVPRSI